MKRFRVKHKTYENSALNIVKNKPWFAQQIQQCLGRYLYPSTHMNLSISFTPPSSQVKTVTGVYGM